MIKFLTIDNLSLKRIEKIIRDSAFDKKKKKPGLKFNPGLALTGVRTTGPCLITCFHHYDFLVKTCSRMATAIAFSRQNTLARACALRWYWEKYRSLSPPGLKI